MNKNNKTNKGTSEAVNIKSIELRNFVKTSGQITTTTTSESSNSKNKHNNNNNSDDGDYEDKGTYVLLKC